MQTADFTSSVVRQVRDLAGMQCAAHEVRHSYKHKHLKAAFAHLPQAKDAATSAGTKARRSRAA